MPLVPAQCWMRRGDVGHARARRCWRILGSALLVPVLLGGLGGCESLAYYRQSVLGQMDILSRRQSIEALLENRATPAELASRLRLVASIREHAGARLGLPDGGSYRQYVDLQREAMVWSVVAAPEFSLQAKQWCYPVIGCASYRGYFKQDAARDYASDLAGQGWDVAVQAVPAYSTLGWFDDPVSSTLLDWPAADLAELIFHELAHQRLYVKGDSQFNEAYASVVAEAGVRDWFAARRPGEPQRAYSICGPKDWLQRRQASREFYHMLDELRAELHTLYETRAAAARLRAQKVALFERYRVRFAQPNADHGIARWFAQGPNNAHLSSVATYRRWVPAFRRLLELAGSDLDVFHQRAADLGALPPQQRLARLSQLAAESPSAGRGACFPGETAAR